MKLRRSRPEEPVAPTADDFTFSVDIAIILRDGIEGYLRLYAEWEERGASADLRAAALTMARRIAAYSRLGFDTTRDLNRLPESHSPWVAVAISTLLAFALVTLAEEEPEVATLLSPDELDALVREHEVDAWLERVLERVPAGWVVA